MSSPSERIDKLTQQIRNADHHYYVLVQPLMADADYDGLMRDLRKLEEEYPELRRADSPTQTVGGGRDHDFDEVIHSRPMLSLENAFTGVELQDWFEGLGELEGGVYVEPKFDGLALSLCYVDGYLTQAATRGDGAVGEDVTQNARTIRNAPLFVEAFVGRRIVIRGEVMIPKQAFAAMNARRIYAGLQELSNPRNAAAGSIRLKDPLEASHRPMMFVAYEVYEEFGQLTTPIHELYGEDIAWLQAHGFTVGPGEVVDNYDDLATVVERMGTIDRPASLYELDGAVLKLDSIKDRQRLGYRSRSPKWALAYKFPPEEATTTLEAIDIQVGRTGVVTPVARLKPVYVGGVWISNVTLHNLDQIRRLDARVGDLVVVRRAGDVVPEIAAVIKEYPRGEEWNMPEDCPHCGHPITQAEGEVAYRCTGGFECPQQRLARLCHFVSRDAMDIDGVGPKLLESLIGHGELARPVDLYRLGLKELLEAEDTEATVRATKALASIQASRNPPLDKFIFALGIDGVGQRTAKTLAQISGSWDRLTRIPQVLMRGYPGLGVNIAESFANVIGDDRWVGDVEHLLNYVTPIPQVVPAGTWSSKVNWTFLQKCEFIRGLTPTKARWLDGSEWTFTDNTLVQWQNDPTKIPGKHIGAILSTVLLDRIGELTYLLEELKALVSLEEGTVTQGRMWGQTVVITGSFDGLDRRDLKEKFEAEGAKVASSVSSSTTLLVCGANAGSKLAEAQKRGIEIWNQPQLEAFLQGTG